MQAAERALLTEACHSLETPFIPHPHRMLIDNRDVFKTESLRSYFRNFRRMLGSEREGLIYKDVQAQDNAAPQMDLKSARRSRVFWGW